MKTAVAPTSIQCYHAIRAEGLVTKRQQQILDVIKEGRDYSLQELVSITGLPVNVISARVNELKGEDLQRLEHGPVRKCRITGRSIRPVRLPLVQKELFQ